MFEPALEARSQLENCFAYALSDNTGSADFFITRCQALCSLKKPNAEVFQSYGSQDKCHIEDIISVPVISIDQLVTKHKDIAPEFLKIDAQGTSYEVLSGAQKNLQDNVLGIQVEVEFLKKYENQKLFSETDILNRSFGFWL